MTAELLGVVNRHGNGYLQQLIKLVFFVGALFIRRMTALYISEGYFSAEYKIVSHEDDSASRINKRKQRCVC